MRRVLLAVLTMLLASLCAGASPAVPLASTATEAADPQTRVALEAGRSGPGLGVQFHGTWSDYSAAERGKVLDRIRASGATWVRLDVGWSMIQPRAGRFDRRWGVPLVDQVIRQAHRRGLKLLVMFWQTPGWANNSRSVRAAPSDPRSYARALGWAANRWKNQVAAWEVWNEPNSSSFFDGADPQEYTELLCHAYDAVHSNDPSARVVFGGTMYNDDDWIRRAYAAGAKGCFDVMATHPYMGRSDAPPETEDDGEVWTLRHVGAVRSVMRSFGDRKPIWATELGWSSHQNHGDEDPWERGVSESVQAEYAVRALQLLADRYPYVRKVFWYNERDKKTGDPHQDGFGILRRDLSPKPVYWALRDHLD